MSKKIHLELTEEQSKSMMLDLKDALFDHKSRANNKKRHISSRNYWRQQHSNTKELFDLLTEAINEQS